MAKFTLEQYLKGRDKAFPKDYAPYENNAIMTVEILNKFFANYKGTLTVTSGFRPEKLNNGIGASKSNHITCLACDFLDLDLKIWKYVLENLQLAKDLGIFFESKPWTSSWVHCQTIPPKSGKRIYIPSGKKADRPDLWNGNYEEIYDL